MFGIGCKKEAKVVIPDVSHQEFAQAQQMLSAVPLKVGNITGVTGTPPPGTYVVSTSPAAGQAVAANSAIDLVVQVPVIVPAVTGVALTDAVSALQQVGLKVAFISKPTVNPFATSKVDQQTPAAQSPVQASSTVTLVVSTPPDIGGLISLVSKQPAYQNLKPEYKNVLDAFIANPSTPRSMDNAPAPPPNPPGSGK
jgi:beta-lactam-binding protein with PASTA domain